MDKLSRMAALARSQGLSYGQYMALKLELEPDPIQEETYEEPEDMEERRCAVCGTPLQPEARKQAKTCGPKCSYELTMMRNRGYYWKNKADTSKEEKQCAVCGQTFTPNRASQKYCSSECNIRMKNINYRKRKKGEQHCR